MFAQRIKSQFHKATIQYFMLSGTIIVLYSFNPTTSELEVGLSLPHLSSTYAVLNSEHLAMSI